MIRAIMNGCAGHMGRVLFSLAESDNDITFAAGIDPAPCTGAPCPVFASPAECDADADVVIDFSSFRAVDALLDFCREKKLPLVLCTTGLTDEQIAKVQEYSAEFPILRSANMSLGINILQKLIADAAKVLAPAGFDMEIVEKHHNLKCDAPSGTALALAESLNQAMDGEYHYTYDRTSRHEKRDPKEIGISAVRGGSIVGEHEIIFAGTDEVVTLKHTAFSKAIFGKGAIAAAKFLAGKKSGLYDMSDVIGG